MVTQEVLIILLLLLFIYNIQRGLHFLAFKPSYQVAFFNNIYNIDSNIYNIIQIKAMVILRMH